MNETTEVLEMIEEMGEELTPGQRVWRHLQKNRMAMAGGVVLVFFFALAAIGFVNSALMSEPMFDANVVRLPDKLMAPFSAPNESQVPRENLPRLGIYVFGTDDLGRDVFARMLEGTFISMSVGFVAIGIATLLGVAIGGIAGFYGEIKPSGAPLFGFIGAGLTGYAVWNELGFLALLFAMAGAGLGLLVRRDGRSLFLEGMVFGALLGLAFGPFEPFGFSGFTSDSGLTVRTPYWREGFLGAACLITLAAFGGAQGRNAEESAADGVSLSAVFGGGLTYFLLFLTGLYIAYPGHASHAWTSIGGAAVFVYLYQRFDVTERLGQFRLPKVDVIYTTIVDVQLSFPSFFVLLTILALVTPNIWIIMVVIGVLGWVGPARFVRAEILSLREQPFVESARASGGSDRLIIFRYLIPNSLAPVLVSATIGIAGAILTEASLSFLGFGVPPPQASWGNIFSDGKKYIFDAPWLTFIPGSAILVVMLAFNLFGEGLRDAMNPRANSR